MFILGYTTGVITSILIFTILAYFRAGIEQRIKIIETKLGNSGPQRHGGIYLPEDEAELSRKEIIEKNKREGRDTKLSELI